jgi:3-hydroxyacyl-CoA dehydrogenase
METQRDAAAIIGTGLIGRGWAIVFARAGFDVRFWDQNPGAAEDALTRTVHALKDMQEAGLVEEMRGVEGRLSVHADLGDALRGAAWAQESIVENVDAKRSLFTLMDAAADGNAILASSTSAILGSLFLSHLPGRSRCIVAHPANPPHLMPVVEVAPSAWHSQDFVERCCALLRRVGQKPVVIRKEVVGFVMNRLQAAVVGEAMALVADGVVDPDGLDDIMKHSLGLRWSFLGPFETMDLNAPAGFYDYATRYGGTYAKTAQDLKVAREWTTDAMERIEAARRKAVPMDKVGERQLWRDKRLMRLLRHRQETDRELGE